MSWQPIERLAESRQAQRDHRLWCNSPAYRKGFEDGKAVQLAEGDPVYVIRLHMEDGTVRDTARVFAELRQAGWELRRLEPLMLSDGNVI